MIERLLIALTRFAVGVVAGSVNDEYLRPGVVYFANHTSHLDLLVILSIFRRRIRRRIRPVAALDYWGATRLRRFIAVRALRAILLDRKHPVRSREAFDAVTARLDAGDSVLIFPEGSRHEQEEPEAFKGGLYLLAEMRPATRFIPVALSGFYRALPKGEFLPAPSVGRVTFGPALTLAPGESRGDFLERCRNTLIQTGRSHGEDR